MTLPTPEEARAAYGHRKREFLSECSKGRHVLRWYLVESRTGWVGICPCRALSSKQIVGTDTKEATA